MHSVHISIDIAPCAFRVKETIAGGRGRQYMQDLHKCPLHYERIPYQDIR